MGYTNRKRAVEKDHASAHANWMGGPSYFLSNPLATLRLAASSCFFGEPQYYHTDQRDKRPARPARAESLSASELSQLRETLDAIDPSSWRGLTPAQLMEHAIDAALAFDAEGTLQFAVELRRDLHVRLTPQVILVRAAHSEAVRELVRVVALRPQHEARHPLRRFAEEIISRPDECANGLAYQLAAYCRKAIPNVLKKCWRDALMRFKPYQLAKYRSEGHEVSLRDVAHLVHPSAPKDSALYQLRAGTLRLEEDATWERSISAKGSSKETWLAALPQMGHMALLRNLRNLVQHDIAPKQFIEQLKDGAAMGQQLPFRYYSAWKALEGGCSAPLQDAIEDCLQTSLVNLPHFSGTVMSLVDNSGSAWGSTTSKMGTMAMAEIGNLTGILTARCSEDGSVGVFGDGLEILPIRKHGSVFADLDRVNHVGKGIGQGTEHGIWMFWDQATKKKQHYDHVFVYSDMQAGHGGLYGIDVPSAAIWGGKSYGNPYIDVPSLIRKYRRTVNPNVMVYLVQIAGYTDSIVPEYYDRTFILGGWSERVLHFAAAMRDLYAAQTGGKHERA